MVMAAMVEVMKVLFSGDITGQDQKKSSLSYCFLNMNQDCSGLRGDSFKEVLQDE